MGLIRTVLGFIISVVAFAIAIKVLVIVLAIAGFIMKLVWLAIVVGVLGLIIWAVYKFVAPRRAEQA
jgi:hypothetical protein